VKVHILRGERRDLATWCGRPVRGWKPEDTTTHPTAASCRRCLYLFYVDASRRKWRAHHEYEAAVARINELGGTP